MKQLCDIKLLSAKPPTKVGQILYEGNGWGTGFKMVINQNPQFDEEVSKLDATRWKPVHMYLTVAYDKNNPITHYKNGDWCYKCEKNDIYPAGLNIFPAALNREGDWHIFKILATTDPELSLPLIQDTLIEQYVSAQGDIKRVYVTIEEVFTEDWDKGRPYKAHAGWKVATDKNNCCIVTDQKRQDAQSKVIRDATEKTYTQKDIDLAIRAAHKALKIEKTDSDGDFVSIDYLYKHLDMKFGSYLYHTEEELKGIIEKVYRLGYEDRDKDIGFGSNLQYCKELID